jgi:phosphatidylglycerophosphate synthase
MSSAVKPLISPKRPDKSGPFLAVLGALAAVAGVVVIAEIAFVLTDGFAARAFAAYVAAAAAVVLLARRHLAPGMFGAANAVTLVRAALIAPLIALLFEAPTAALAWFAIVLAVAGLVLDGVDGRLARRSGQTTAFGARFDMETDASLILVLSALCWQFGKAGAWILAAGLLRYLFVAAGRLLPWIRSALPPSRRRQTVCVVQIVALLLCLSPLLPPPFSAAAGALGLAILAWSFLIDTIWLARRA